VSCYADVMSIRRITISVPRSVATRIKKAAATTPVSAWVTAVVLEHLDDAEIERQWRDFYRDVRPTPKDIREADGIYKRLMRPARRRRAA